MDFYKFDRNFSSEDYFRCKNFIITGDDGEIKSVYKEDGCKKCSSYYSNDIVYDHARIFSTGFDSDYCLDPRLIEDKILDFSWAEEDLCIVSDKFLHCLVGNKIQGYSSKPLGNSGWHAFIVTTITNPIWRDEKDNRICSACSRNVYDPCYWYEDEIGIPDSDNTFFIPRGTKNLGSRILMTDKVAIALKNAGIVKGKCHKILKNRSDKMDFSSYISLNGSPSKNLLMSADVPPKLSAEPKINGRINVYRLSGVDKYTAHNSLTQETEKKLKLTDLGDVVIKFEGQRTFKKEYSSIICGDHIDTKKVFSSGFKKPFYIDSARSVKFACDFDETSDGFFIVSDKFLECLIANQVKGFKNHPLGASKWHVLEITELTSPNTQKWGHEYPDCQNCGRIEPRYFSCASQVGLPSGDNTLFLPSNIPSAELLMTEKVALALQAAGIKDGYCCRLLHDDEVAKQDEMAELGRKWKAKSTVIPLKGKVAKSADDPAWPPVFKTKIRKSKNKTLADEAAIATLEQLLGCSLAADYRYFLLQHNGGKPSPNRYGDEEYDLDAFLPVQELAASWTEFQQEQRDYAATWDGELPEDQCLPICPDTSGNLFCLVIKGPNTGRIAFFDHEVNETCVVEDSFTSLFNALKKEEAE